MGKNKIVEWLESPDGQKWSEGRHNLASRDGGAGTTGTFGEIKTDYESCAWHGAPCLGEHRSGDTS